MIELLLHPDPRLRLKCQSVSKIDSEFKQWVHDMVYICNSNRGIALSAPQVGLSYNFFIWLFIPSVVINPTVLRRRGRPEIVREGCLSIPGYAVDVPRQPKLEVMFYDIGGAERQMKLSGEQARVFSHEWDHLQGRLILDYE